MNKKVAKQLRKICNPVDLVSRRVYQRLKKQYNKLPRHAKRDFINILRETTFELEQEQSGSILDQE